MHRSTEQQVSISSLVEAMARTGATVSLSNEGEPIAEGVENLPTALRDDFFQCDPSALKRFLQRSSHRTIPAINSCQETKPPYLTVAAFFEVPTSRSKGQPFLNKPAL